MNQTDVLIIGAGVTGLSIAYHLAGLKPDLKITVVEKEKFPGLGSTAQCTGGIRHQFTSPVNVQMTMLSLPHFKKFTAETGYPIYFRQQGYLFLTSRNDRLAGLNEMAALLESFHLPIETLTPADIAERYPYIACDDLAGGTFCPLDGYADPHGVVQGYLKQAVRRGVQVSCEERVVSIAVSGGGVCGVTTDRRAIGTGIVINAAGPQLAEIAALAGVTLPAGPFRRQVYVCTPVPSIKPGIPLTVDLDTGLYIHAEKSGTLLLGGTDRDTAPGLDTAVDRSLLNGFIEAALLRFPSLQDTCIQRVYAGIRCLTPDYHAILGETGIKGFYCAGGFSGHGFMHAPATGLCMARLILGEPPPIDITALSPERFRGGLRPETNVF